MGKRSKIEPMPSNDVKTQLQVMFPQVEDSTIDTAISTTSNVEEAIDALLTPNGSTNEGIILSGLVVQE